MPSCQTTEGGITGVSEVSARRPPWRVRLSVALEADGLGGAKEAGRLGKI